MNPKPNENPVAQMQRETAEIVDQVMAELRRKVEAARRKRRHRLPHG